MWPLHEGNFVKYGVFSGFSTGGNWSGNWRNFSDKLLTQPPTSKSSVHYAKNVVEY